MNRAQRRAQKGLRERFRSQVEQERNGAPVPPEIAARMTRSKDPEQLWQVMATERETKELVRISPMMNADACGMICEAANRAIIAGQRRDWLKAETYPMTPISQGVY